MTDKPDSFADHVANGGKAIAACAREFGIEWTPSDGEELLREAFKEAMRESWRRVFLDMIEGSER